MKGSNRLYALVLILFITADVWGQTDPAAVFYGDLLPDAPSLAARGEYQVGVRTLQLKNPNQIDLLNSTKDQEVYYDRPLTVEIWYPARLEEGAKEMVVYNEVMGNFNSPDRPLIPFTFNGRAAREAAVFPSNAPYPLIIVSHGYTGSRYMMTYLTDNLASKGYVVVAIDHTDSTFRDAAAFHSTLLNRSLDDLFVLNEMERLSTEPDSFLQGLVDVNTTGLIGYSMGGYGALNVAGGGYSSQALQLFSMVSQGSRALEKRMLGNEAFINSFDSRIKAVVALAPWGMERGVWDAEGLAGIRIPTFFVAGSKDDISGYQKGIKAIYEGAIHTERYLLTYENARHNIAPNPPPAAALQAGLDINEYLRYADSVWDQRRINNINQHFITAFLGLKLKKITAFAPYLNAAELENQDPWEGFLPRTSVGLELLYEKPE